MRNAIGRRIGDWMEGLFPFFQREGARSRGDGRCGKEGRKASAVPPGRDVPDGLVRRIWENLWPIFGLMFLNFLVGYTDVYVAGLLGAEVQAAVGFVSQQYFLLIIVGNALAIGTVTLISQAVGARLWTRVFDLTRQVLILSVVLGIGLWGLAALGAPAVVRLFGLPESLRPLALTYVRIYAAALMPNTLLIVSGAVFRAIGKPLIAFKIMAFVTLLNIGANFGLVFGMGPLPHLGYRGIAWATVIAMSAGLFVTLLVFRGPDWLAMRTVRWGLSKAVVSRVARISWPAALLQIGWNGGNVAIYQFLGRLGEESVHAMAAYANGLRLEAITYLPAFAFNMAAAVLVGQSLGAGRADQARSVAWKVAGGGMCLLSGIAGILFWTAPGVAHQLTANPDVWKQTVQYLRINLLVAPLMVFSMVLGGAMQGAGDTKGVMKVILLAIWLVRIPLAAFLCFSLGWNATGVWIAMDVSMVLQAGLMVWRFQRGGWEALSTGDRGESRKRVGGL